MSNYQQRREMVLKEVSMHDDVPENFTELNLAGSNQDMELFDKDTASLNVVDVYKIAASIGKEFERLTDEFGGFKFSGAMPKIIRILEMFEQLVKMRDAKDSKISSLSQELENINKKMTLKNITEAQEMDKLHMAYEDSVKELRKKNKQMEEDNKRLLAIVSDQNERSLSEEDFVKQMQTMSEQQTEIEKLKEENRSQNRLINEHVGDCQALQSQVERLAKLNCDLRQKQAILQQQATSLINEKSALESKLNSKRALRSLPKQGPSIEEDPEKESSRKDDKKVEKCDKQPEAEVTTQANTTDEPSSPSSRCDDPLLANKLVIDLNDPNRPRYTLQELLEVLNDRNQLKARCFRLEEELIFYKDVSRSLGYVDESWEEISSRELGQYSGRVYVPEPPANEVSGIRRFFSYLTSPDLWGKQSPTSSANRSPQPIRRTKPSTYHEAKDQLVSEDEVSNLAPRLLLDSSSVGDDVIVRSSSEMLPLNKYIEEEKRDDANTNNNNNNNKLTSDETDSVGSEVPDISTSSDQDDSDFPE